MAVYTQISTQKIQEIVRQGYGVNVAQVKPVAQGIENTIYQLTDEHSRRYAFVIFEVVPAPLVEAYCIHLERFQQALHDKATENTKPLKIQVPTGAPLLVPGAGRRYSMDVNDEEFGCAKPAVLQPWIDGDHRVPDRRACEQLGQFLGILSQQKGPSTTADMPHIPTDQHLCRIGIVEQTMMNYPRGVQAKFELFKQQVEPVMKTHERLPYALVHGDLFADNALFNDDGIVGVIDFFNASWAPRLLDLAICLMDWCVRDEQFDQSLCHSLIQGFKQNCEPVTSFEKETWPDLVRLAAFRFWCTRQEYYLACRTRGVQPVQNRAPEFCENVLGLVDDQKELLQRLWNTE